MRQRSIPPHNKHLYLCSNIFFKKKKYLCSNIVFEEQILFGDDKFKVVGLGRRDIEIIYD